MYVFNRIVHLKNATCKRAVNKPCLAVFNDYELTAKFTFTVGQMFCAHTIGN